MPRQLTLLGTIHTDLWGMKRLYRAIGSIRPKTITFELERAECVHGFSAERRDFLGKQIRGILNLEEEQETEFKSFLREYGYESKIALGLQSCGYPIHRIDKEISEENQLSEITMIKTEEPIIVREYSETREYIFSELSVIESPDEREIVALYAAFVFFEPGQRQEIIDYEYDHHLETIRTEPARGLLQRDQFMEERIRDLWGKTPGDLLHVGGIFHAQAPYHNLYERLQDLHPVRRKLNEF